jgi:tRNA nucleotidyltransferase/poly(A) polymerase
MSKKQNPKLKEGDRIVLIYMPGEDVDTGTKGKVKRIGQQPSFGSEFDYMYDVEWYDDDEKVISTLSLLPQSDTWMLDREYSQNDLNEGRIIDLDELISRHEWSRLFKKSDLKTIIEYLNAIKRLGVVNMFESGQFLGKTEEYLTKYFDLYRMQQDLDDKDEELIKKILEMSEIVRNIMISAAVTDLEQKNKEITGSSATHRVNRLATEVVKYFMGQ